MQNKKLIILLSSMDKKELKECSKYLSANLRSTSEEYKLFEYIMKSKGNWKAKRLEIERVKNDIKKEKEVSMKKFEDLMSALVVRIEKFIMQYDLDNHKIEFENQLRLGDFYKRKGLDKFFRQSQRKLLDLLQKIPTINADYHLYKLHQLHQAYFSNLEIGTEILDDMQSALAIFYEQKKMVYTIEDKNLKHLYNKEIFNKKTIDHSSTGIILKEQLALFNNFEEASFLQLKQVLIKEIENFSKEDAYRLLNYLINYCAPKIRKGEEVYIRHLNDLYDLGFDSKTSFFNGKLSETTFINIIGLKSRMPIINHKEINQLIEDCSKYTNTENRQGLQYLAWSLHFFTIGNYNKSLNFAGQQIITRKDIKLYFRAELIKLASQCCIMKTYPHPEALIRNSRNFFKKKPQGVSENNRIGALNLIKIIEMLWFDKATSKIISFRDSCQYLSYRYWVNQQLK